MSFTDDGGNAESLTSAATGAVAPPPSTDDTLSGLTLSGVDIGTFDPATTEYATDVDHDVTATTITPTVNDDGAAYAIKLDGVADADGTVALAVGDNTVTVEVTAEDRQTTRTYTVSVTRAAAPPSDDATLSGLALSGVNFGTFNSATTDYTADVDHEVSETTVTAHRQRRRGDLRNQPGRRGRRRRDGGPGRGRQRYHRGGHRRGRADHQDLHCDRHPRRSRDGQPERHAGHADRRGCREGPGETGLERT